jgi:hypothetical protein
MEKNDLIPNCRFCPYFELAYVKQSRYMAICHATENVLEPVFADAKSQFINKDTVRTVTFQTLDNCPEIEQLRKEGKLPWATATIDFLNNKK